MDLRTGYAEPAQEAVQHRGRIGRRSVRVVAAQVDRQAHVGTRQPVRERMHQRGLADPGHAVHRDHADTVADRRGQHAKLGIASAEVRRYRRQHVGDGDQ